ncbi:hypothetical protein [Paenibacillus odorifer]|uniref:hypothetical protein n=1 Tax=Paenibacillus TaxID=44249 RepID=UPI00096FF648|nr:hypothetical protein [Paenibacillus odorifer]OME26348.1 hypothetical protein BSK57_08630 [Paenibacillus odorifer]OME35802.1 hypothetical protein BSK63_05615 [Paenibacillus odorifer]OME40720.1 hypothetical protein BSK46_06800 [Paenibacillus odorifer]
MITEYVNIKQITASIGGYFGSSYIVEVEFVNGKITYEVREDGGLEPSLAVQRDNEGIAIFREELTKCRILGWEHEYIDPNALDGTHWSLDIVFEDKVLHINGSNAYPKEWKRFCKSIRKLTGRPFE